MGDAVPDLPANVLRRIVLTADSQKLMVWMTSANGAAHYVNPAWIAYTGLSAEQSLGLGWRAALHPDEVQSAISRWLHCVKLKVANEDPLRYRSMDGTYHLKFSHTFPLENKDGEVIHWLGTAVESASEHHAVLAFFNVVLSILYEEGQDFTATRLQDQLAGSVLVTGVAK